MKDKGAGWILNIASIESTTPYPSAPAYATTKWGLRGWSKSCFMVSSPVPYCIQLLSFIQIVISAKQY